MNKIKGIRIGMASCGIAAGAESIYKEIDDCLKKNSFDIPLVKVGCVGMCHNEPIMDILTKEGKYTYGNLKPKDVSPIIESHLKGREKKDKNLITKPGETYSYFEKQKKIVTENAGVIDPESIEEYIQMGGYKSLEQGLNMKPEEIIEEIKKSGLRGRGGAGFPTHLKWQFTAREKSKEKYIICNADEGDPGAFMDRSLLEGDPHRVIEGMIIGGWAISASEGYFYVRAEYPLAIKRLEIAIHQAREKGFLGKNILGNGFDFDIKIKKGAGAFVCGEETALLKSIQGERGMPRPRPPFPAQKGLWGKPTVINNVETWANIPWIIRNGGEALAEIGTKGSKGTKVFALAGKVKRGGSIEVPMGTTLREIIFDIGGGMEEDMEFKGVQLGGPSGGILPKEYLDTPVDYESLTKAGAIMGSGGMIVLSNHDCMVDTARFFLDFTQKESCGKCAPCRVGTKRMLEILDRIIEGKAEEEDLNKLSDLAEKVKEYSLCGLGQTAPNPVLTTLRYFKDEYLSHILESRCPAKVCENLIRYRITDKCTGCTLCAKKCPTNTIIGEVGSKHTIIQDNCIKCGTCLEVCPVSAVEVVDNAG